MTLGGLDSRATGPEPHQVRRRDPTARASAILALDEIRLLGSTRPASRTVRRAPLRTGVRRRTPDCHLTPAITTAVNLVSLKRIQNRGVSGTRRHRDWGHMKLPNLRGWAVNDSAANISLINQVRSKREHDHGGCMRTCSMRHATIISASSESYVGSL